MIFFVAMPLVIGFMNFVVPLQLGVRDVAFPTLNNVSFWLSASGALLVNLSLFVGEFARTGWLAFPPLSEKAFSPGVGVDYYLVALQISGVGTVLTGVNFVTTILKIRAPGMSYLRMPVFCWTALASNLLIIAAFPVLTVTLALLMLDRYLGFHFFTNDGGGNSMLYMNLIWVWGHPEVYILVLPAFGIYSEVASTFSGKPLFGYRSMVFATMVICIVSFCVWLHHFFTMGAGADVNAVFGIASMIIGIPTGREDLQLAVHDVRRPGPLQRSRCYYLLGFMLLFVGGGLTGILLAIPPVDFIVHNSLFLVAHFHHVIIPGVVFAIFAGYNYWFPKAFGFTLDERLGKTVFWCWFVGFNLAFMPSYLLGFWGGTRRMQHISDPSWKPWLAVELVGAFVHRRSARADGLPAPLFDQDARTAPRPHRRSVGRPDARVADAVAAAALQFRGASRRSRRRSLLAPQAAGDRTRGADPRARLPADRNAGEHADRRDRRLLHLGLRLRDHLVHLVAGDPRPDRRLRGLRLVRLARRA